MTQKYYTHEKKKANTQKQISTASYRITNEGNPLAVIKTRLLFFAHLGMEYMNRARAR